MRTTHASEAYPQYHGSFSPPPRRRGPFQILFGWFSGLLRFVLATVLFFALMVIFVYWLVCRVFIPPGDLRAPDLRGKPFLEAAKLLRSQNISIKWERDQPSDTVEEGSIISQNPAPNTPVKKGSSVQVVVSGGIALVPLPDLRRVPQNRAGLLLHKAGLEVGIRTLLPSPENPMGIVLESDPPAGTGVPQGSKVNLLVATGQTRVTQAMPNLQGMNLDQAREVLTQAGLFATEVQVSAAGAAPGQVVGQKPAPGETVSDSTQITLNYTPQAAATPVPEAADAVTTSAFTEAAPPGEAAIPAVSFPGTDEGVPPSPPSVPEPGVDAVETRPSDLEGPQATP